jgi:type I restriction enzyme S subunit
MKNLSDESLNTGAVVGPQGDGVSNSTAFPAYPTYKDSGVEWLGVVPEHWGVSPLKWLVEQITDKATISDFQVGLENIDGWTGCFIQTDSEFAGEGIQFRQGDILFGKLRPYLAKVWLAGKSGQAVGDFFVLRPCAIDGEFLHKYILTSAVIENLNASTIGAKMPRVGWEDMSALEVTLPPYKEQVQIARFLNHEVTRIGALIEEQRRLIELLKEKRQAVISHAVTKGLNPTVQMKDSGVVWLGEVPEHWMVSQLKFNTLEMQTGPFGSQLHAEDYVDGGIPLVNPAHMIDGKIIPDSRVSVDEETWLRLKRHALAAGEIVFARRGELGRCAVVTNEQDGWLCGTGSLKARLSARLDAEYAYLMITSKGPVVELSLESKGSTMENLNTETLGRVKLPLPPIGEQKAILEYVDEVLGHFAALVDAAESGIGLMTERRSALISAVVTGKIDVRSWRPMASAPTPKFAEEAV